MSKLKEVTDREFIKCDLPLSSNGNIIWKDTVNKNFSIRYDGIIYNFTIRPELFMEPRGLSKTLYPYFLNCLIP